LNKTSLTAIELIDNIGKKYIEENNYDYAIIIENIPPLKLKK
jgi:hypothetical protein